MDNVKFVCGEDKVVFDCSVSTRTVVINAPAGALDIFDDAYPTKELFPFYVSDENDYPFEGEKQFEFVEAFSGETKRQYQNAVFTSKDDGTYLFEGELVQG